MSFLSKTGEGQAVSVKTVQYAETKHLPVGHLCNHRPLCSLKENVNSKFMSYAVPETTLLDTNPFYV